MDDKWELITMHANNFRANYKFVFKRKITSLDTLRYRNRHIENL